MVVRIRLARWGAKRHPFYGIVAINSKSARDAKPLERLGTFDPIPDSSGVKHVQVNVERVKYWISVGAQPTDRAHWLLSRMDLIPPHPKQLQSQGHVSLSDRKTWNVLVKDENGNILTTLSSQEAQEQFQGTRLEKDLETNHNIVHVGQKPLNFKNIQLDGTQIPKRPLKEDERLFILKEYLGLA